MELKEILKIVQEKYPNAKIEPVVETTMRIEQEMVRDDGGWETNNYIDIQVPDYEHIADEIIGTPFKILYNGKIRINEIDIENNIIELKHYLDIEITWKDLENYIQYFFGINNELINTDDNNEFINYQGLHLYRNGLIKIGSETITDNKSLWQIYNIIKNLVE